MIKEGGPYKRYMELNCCDSCEENKSCNPKCVNGKCTKGVCKCNAGWIGAACDKKAGCVYKGDAFCKPYKAYCKDVREGGPHKAWMEKNCCDLCKKPQPGCVDKGDAFCKPYKAYCKDVREGGPHKAWMEKNCCD